jgi:DNA-binding GntR family transcriptional regulator
MPPGTVHEHRAILEAIQGGDLARARALIVDHHWNIEQRFQRAIELAQSGSSPSGK